MKGSLREVSQQQFASWDVSKLGPTENPLNKVVDLRNKPLDFTADFEIRPDPKAIPKLSNERCQASGQRHSCLLWRRGVADGIASTRSHQGYKAPTNQVTKSMFLKNRSRAVKLVFHRNLSFQGRFGRLIPRGVLRIETLLQDRYQDKCGEVISLIYL